MAESKYLALTIGPIYKTLQQAQKTRELWAASFIFSRLMERLIIHINEQGGLVKKPLLITESKEDLFGAGVYPDRLYAEANNLDEAKVQKAIDAAIAGLAIEMLPLPYEQAVLPENNLIRFWKEYFRIDWVIKSLDESDSNNYVKIFSPYLDTLELQEPYFKEQPKDDYLLRLLKSPYQSILANALNGKAKGVYKGLMKNNQRFPTTADIATYELYQNPNTRQAYQQLFQIAKKKAEEIAKKEIEDESDEELTQFFIELFSIKNSILTEHRREYHKYFCVVHADGDSISTALNSIPSKELQSDFSQVLADFRIEAAFKINQFGGKPVFIGGDDMLFFAPVCTESGSIFRLVKELDDAFAQRVGEFLLEKQLDNVIAPTISFGITVTYHKFPLFEAREMSQEQLNERAKKFSTSSKQKDAVAFRLAKHSGSYFEAVLTKNLLSKFLLAESQVKENKVDLLSSIVYKLDLLEKLMGQLVDPATQLLPIDRLANLFDNFFNERVHRQHKAQMGLIQELVLETYNTPGKIGNEEINLNQNLYAILRMLKFVTDNQS